MSKTIVANCPARTAKQRNGKSVTFPAYVNTFTQNDAGTWFIEGYAVREADVIEVCTKASNWSAIRAEHFRMHGFHS